MSTYLALLGNTPNLSYAELSALGAKELQRLGEYVATLSFDADEDAQQLLNLLGGTVKIAREVAQLSLNEQPQVSEKILQLLIDQAGTDQAIDFAIGEIGRDHLPAIELSDLKQELRSRGIKARYVEGTRHGLNAASLKQNSKLTEILIIQTASGISLCITAAFQDVDEWAMRDRQKPFAEHKRGLLPPKVARILVNLSLGQGDPTTATICDPFCGSGTVIFEALLRGARVVGSDLDPVAVQGTKDNLVWFLEQYPEYSTVPVIVEQADAASLKLPPRSISHLVTEPFLGKPKPLPEQLPNIFRGLERMYLGAFKHWRSFLAENAQLVVIFPVVDMEVGTHRRVYTLQALIDKLAAIGYTTSSEPIMYARPGAIVQRAIYTFRYVTR